MDIQVIWPTHPFDWDHNILNFTLWSWTMTLPPILVNDNKCRVFFFWDYPLPNVGIVKILGRNVEIVISSRVLPHTWRSFKQKFSSQFLKLFLTQMWA